MSGYIGNIPTPQATQTRDTFTATSGQTSFATSGYTPGFLDVFLNGVHLVNGTDYTASNGSDVVLTTGATTGDDLEVLSFSTFEVNSQTFTGTTTLTGDLQATTATFSGAVTGTDLTLSGGVYLGGTGSANLLDDYEEGTFTLNATATLASLLGTWPTSVTANYTKVGSVVTIAVPLNGANYGFTSLTGYYKWTGLPFTPSPLSGSGVFTTSAIASATTFHVFISGLDFWFYAPINTNGTNGGVATAMYLTDA